MYASEKILFALNDKGVSTQSKNYDTDARLFHLPNIRWKGYMKPALLHIEIPINDLLNIHNFKQNTEQLLDAYYIFYSVRPKLVFIFV